MKNILTINFNDIEPADYTLRRTVKAVIVNGEGKVMLLPSNLIGGGVEEGETDIEALHREALEEAGFKIEIVRELGEMVAYRDVLKRKYVVIGYLCNFIEKVAEVSLVDSGEAEVVIEDPAESIARFESEIENLKKQDPSDYEGDNYQAKLYNRMMTLGFLKEAFK